jgi:hypothetical protein
MEIKHLLDVFKIVARVAKLFEEFFLFSISSHKVGNPKNL